LTRDIPSILAAIEQGKARQNGKPIQNGSSNDLESQKLHDLHWFIMVYCFDNFDSSLF
jgi:hypothetical protein